VKKGGERQRERKKMKSMNDNNGSNNNWLGFSLSPHMKMEVTSDHPQHHQHQYHHQGQPSSAAVPTSFYLAPQLNNSGICYLVGENGGYHSPLSVMPLKSDGSLCIMEALSRSQPEGVLNKFIFLFIFVLLKKK
jgi:AP2-like factor (ANT lineage)